MESGGHVRESGGLVRDSGGRDKGRRWTNQCTVCDGPSQVICRTIRGFLCYFYYTIKHTYFYLIKHAYFYFIKHAYFYIIKHTYLYILAVDSAPAYLFPPCFQRIFPGGNQLLAAGAGHWDPAQPARHQLGNTTSTSQYASVKKKSLIASLAFSHIVVKELLGTDGKQNRST